MLRARQPRKQDSRKGLKVFLQLEYLVATVHGKLRSGRAGPFVKVEGCCD
jgi:hypothetical protein